MPGNPHMFLQSRWMHAFVEAFYENLLRKSGGGPRHVSVCTRWYVLRIHKGIMRAARLAPGEKELAASQSLASASTHVLYVTGGKQGCERNGEAETDGEKPGGNQCWFLPPLFRLRKRTRAQLPTSMPWTEAERYICLFFFFFKGDVFVGAGGGEDTHVLRCSVSCPFFLKKKDVESHL